ncbi:hypothetical protein J2T13_000918 [Paenibacillus sp. DS2015]|uniref:hypothetical protein n=1 Tax=Paenibacillus sp. DS2015 TaxID=3373917 RepID=UPI003D202EEB
MKSTRKAVTFTVLAIGLVFSATATHGSISKASTETIQPDKASVEKKVHSTKIKSFYNDMTLTKDYLGTLNEKELLEAVAEYSTEEDNTFNTSLAIISPHLKNKMQGGIHTQELELEVKNKSYNKINRLFLIDLYSNMKSQDQNDFVSETLLTLATDTSENDDIRAYALGELKEESRSKAKKDKQDKILVDLFNDATTPNKVKGNTLTAMRRTNNPYLAVAIHDVIDNYEQKDSLLIRSAVVTAGKSRQNNVAIKIEQIAKNTLDPKVYASSVYALGLLRNEESLKSILEVYGKYNNSDIGNGALIMNEKLILNMLDNNQSKDNVLYAIKAAELISLHSALEKLKEISNHSLDSELRTKAIDAFNKINEVQRSAFPSNTEKWED